MEDAFVKMADCGSGNVGTCISSLFIMKYNCLENLSHNVFNNKNNNLSDAKCLTLEEKRYFDSSHKLDVTQDCVLNACKNLHESSDSAICSSDSTSEDSDNYKKKRCMDRYDSSESSDSGVLTGSTCSESSSNSGTSDITDPCSPYSVTSFHLGDDSGLSSTLQSKSSTFSHGELLVTSKMLPENSSPEGNEISCWEWDKTLDWNERYELTSDDIEVEVKNSDFFGVIEEKSSGDENDENTIENRPNCYSPNQENTINFNIPLNSNLLTDRKSLNTIQNHFDGKNLTRSLGKNITINRPFADDEPADVGSINNSDKYVLSDVLDIKETKNYFYDHQVFQTKRTACSVTKFQMPIYNDESTKSDMYHGRMCDNDKCAITATKTSASTNKFIVNNSYPLDFFNILPSVFKNPNLHSVDDECEEFDNEEAACEDDCVLSSTFSSKNFAEKDKYCKSELEILPQNISNLSKNMIINNNNNNNNNIINNNNNNSNNNNNNNLIISPECHIPSKLNTTSEMERDRDNTQRITDAVPVYKKNIRFPTNKKSSFLSERICRWSDCVDHISSSTKLIEHLQMKHVNPQTFSETFICLWNGCKVFGRPSCSRTWLERHVLSHGGNKPYRCIVDNCGQRFSSQLMLERHINQHFKTPKEYSDGVSDATPKLIRRNGQKLRYRRQPYSVRSRTDGFDAGIMSQLQFLLVQMARRSKSVSLNVMDSRNFLHVTFQPKVIGSRRETNGNVKYLIRWYPYNALEDEWLPKSEIENTRSVPLWKLPTSVQQLFWDSVFPNQRPTVRQSRKYKPDSSDTR